MRPSVHIISCILDPDERYDSIREKLYLLKNGKNQCDPLVRCIEKIKDGKVWDLITSIDSVDIPEWLSPCPESSLNGISVEHFVSFIDGDGCRYYAELLRQKTREILPEIPMVIAVDHSIAAGAMWAVGEYYDAQDVTFIVLDSHTDAIPVSALLGGISYDMKNNPESPFDPEDPFLKDRKESYNASSFLLYGIEEGWIKAENLILIGPSDIPPKRAHSIKDDGVKRYVSAFKKLNKLGVKLLEKKELVAGLSKLKGVLKDISTPYVYVSVDMDIGAKSAVEGVRFKDRIGLNRPTIVRIAQEIQSLLERGKTLVGMDVAEFNGRAQDERVYELFKDLVSILLG